MATRRQRRARAAAYFVVDIVVVLLFVVAGRDTRGSDFSGTFVEALPFLAGTALGWALAKAWRQPRAVRWSGVVIWVCTVAIGLPVRELLGESTDSRFIVITFIALGMFLLGWRGAAWVLDAFFGRATEKPVDEKYRR